MPLTIPSPNARVFAPALTRFTPELQVDQPGTLALCRWLVAQGAGLAVFGTNSEANSLSLREKRELLDALVEGGIAPHHLLPGVGLCALPETIELARQAVQLGCAGVLVLPPFYYKPVSEDGLFAWYAGLIESLGSDALRVYLYHIPQFTGVPISTGLIARLVKAYPQTVVGIKDSSGDWANTERVLREFPGFEVFPASESLLEKALPLGAAGCISATANVQPRAIAQAIAAHGGEGFARAQARVREVREVFQRRAMIPALKAVVAEHFDDAGWRAVRAPLEAAAGAWPADLLGELAQQGFSMEPA